MSTPTTAISDHTLAIQKEMRVRASLEATFAALLEELGPGFETPDGVSLKAKVEAWPGGRWYRDLGDGNGHFWAQVQAIKRPTLLEFSGPLMMSAPVVNNVQYRLAAEGDETVIRFQHFAFGVIPEGFGTGMPEGWGILLQRVQQRAERGGKN